MTKKFYVTTAIDYVNAKPHIGHAFEKVLADAIVRWKKLQGEKVFFLTGTDENAQKNAQAAEKEKIPAKKFVDKNSKLFVDLCKRLNVNYDDFIRTTEERHIKTAQKIFQKNSGWICSLKIENNNYRFDSAIVPFPARQEYFYPHPDQEVSARVFS